MKKEKDKKVDIKTKKIDETKKISTPLIWNPFDFMESMERFFWDDPWKPMWRRRWGSLIPGSFLFDRWLEPDLKQTSIDMIDTGKEYKIIAEMPGVDKKDVEISVTNNNISICGNVKSETKEEDKNYLRRERSYSTICRSISFPEEVNPDKAEAVLKDGILEIKIAKKTPIKGRNIPVK
ncbi:MAG: Hsp20/alpha crystallin family protein [Candidatus Thermoplasmatota archaeon]|jgi:HSP20 family protein|nr:Hsp20/alpha crystallin family protein [Candidatus Thermoplasmatota archaeon]